jgi:hypothetical protein
MTRKERLDRIDDAAWLGGWRWLSLARPAVLALLALLVRVLAPLK